MNAAEVVRILDAKIICGEDRLNDVEFDSAFGSDMMSDVLAYVKPTTLLLTGMVNPHVIRTAEMLDIKGIVVVRGKSVPEELVEEAEEQDIIILASDETMYTTCGKMYASGLPGCKRSDIV